mmetsp:Transcript_27726/g.70653  ORF Transcript_27726/g.70653 Transcript_27726/m.70653 type:complete len:417 (-) Transcript_27726:564-1814(-)|eukprot:CAMPEP_0202866258 /NCGR_PEP_ID=MMETSP1391-20130828/7285_1 /ASSEMBLY_ACC=CAM_ASM_000867 /TAXON_ID=1034604 /ORGANISM="Chlamydomonas leiostraca, Strain SAG 11-49" /LENGTH=416 /DNA_ID=CAMNT_0049546191 /DNA_START=105 /DNA_END=1355 /DNA_ORIENTATION=+
MSATRVSARLQAKSEEAAQTKTSGGRSISAQDIQLVQNLIERCLQMYMPHKDVVQTLQNQAKIEPGFTSLVWQKLEEQNPEFFKAYYLRLKLKEQIVMFNYLVDQQMQMMHKLHASWMQAMPLMQRPMGGGQNSYGMMQYGMMPPAGSSGSQPTVGTSLPLNPLDPAALTGFTITDADPGSGSGGSGSRGSGAAAGPSNGAASGANGAAGRGPRTPRGAKPGSGGAGGSKVKAEDLPGGVLGPGSQAALDQLAGGDGDPLALGDLMQGTADDLIDGPHAGSLMLGAGGSDMPLFSDLEGSWGDLTAAGVTGSTAMDAAAAGNDRADGAGVVPASMQPPGAGQGMLNAHGPGNASEEDMMGGAMAGLGVGDHDVGDGFGGGLGSNPFGLMTDMADAPGQSQWLPFSLDQPLEDAPVL